MNQQCGDPRSQLLVLGRDLVLARGHAVGMTTGTTGATGIAAVVAAGSGAAPGTAQAAATDSVSGITAVRQNEIFTRDPRIGHRPGQA